MATKKIKPQTQNTVLELTGKFGPQGLVSKLFGSSKEKKDMEFTGKAKVIKKSDTASKIKPLQQGNNLIDILSKIYTFLQKNYDADKLASVCRRNIVSTCLAIDWHSADVANAVRYRRCACNSAG